MKTILINRDIRDQKQALGVCYIKDEKGQIIFKSESIERGWMNNQNMISCVPDGTYDVIREFSPHFKTELYELKGVPGRSECKFHTDNFARQLNGCIPLGSERKDLDGDGYYDVTNSSPTMERFHKALGGDLHAKVIINSI